MGLEPDWSTELRGVGVMMPWEQFIADLDPYGSPGVTVEHHETHGIKIDALVFRMWLGAEMLIVGVLFHYPDGTPFEAPGSANLMVHPGCRRAGIGTALLQAAIRLFDLDLDRQTYTADGAALRDSLVCPICHGSLVIAVAGPDYFGNYDTDDCPCQLS